MFDYHPIVVKAPEPIKIRCTASQQKLIIKALSSLDNCLCPKAECYGTSQCERCLRDNKEAIEWDIIDDE